LVNDRASERRNFDRAVMSRNVSNACIRRPVATTLLTIALVLGGLLAFSRLPVGPLPQIDFPAISVTMALPGANPETMASAIAAPLEHHLGQIADVTEMTSISAAGVARINMQFGLDRDLNGAARDVQAAISAAHAELPSNMPANPSYRKANLANAPIMVLALTSPTRLAGGLYDLASNLLQQRLSQLEGVGEVDVLGGALPAVRVELNPDALFKYGVGFEDARAAIAAANADSPKGTIEDGEFHYQISVNDQASRADQYRDFVVAVRDNADIHLGDIAEVVDSVEDLRNAGFSNGTPGIAVVISRQPGANILATIDRIQAELPRLRAELPGDVELKIAIDRSTTIRKSLGQTETTLLVAILLVAVVVFAFLRNLRAAAVPCVAVPVSIFGTFIVMYFCNFSLDNLSLMALSISTGFVVDDAMVVLESISRYLEAGANRTRAAVRGVADVRFTVLSISLSLVVVFAPLVLAHDIAGRLFREFAVTISAAVLISLVVSLTTTPMMCAVLLENRRHFAPGRVYVFFERLFDAMKRFYQRTLAMALRHRRLVMLLSFVMLILNVYLFANLNYGLFPAQDTGLLIGFVQGDQSISFQAMKQKLLQLETIVQSDTAVGDILGTTGGGFTNAAVIYVALKPIAERRIGADEVVDRLRAKLRGVAGAKLFLTSVSDLRAGARQANAAFQYSLLSDDLAALRLWTPRLEAELGKSAILRDISSDLQQGGLVANVTIDRAASMRFGLSPLVIDNALYDAFGQRQVSTIYDTVNQYHVVMEVAPRYWRSPDILNNLWISSSGAPPSGAQLSNARAGLLTAQSGGLGAVPAPAADPARNQAMNALAVGGRASASAGAGVSVASSPMVPLSALASMSFGRAPLTVNHQGNFAAATVSYNLAPGHSLGEARKAIEEAMLNIGLPSSIHSAPSGAAAVFQGNQNSMPWLAAGAIVAIYIVLGILYESFIHPITILSTLPSASVGAVLILKLTNTEFTIISFVGVILLIGLVKKNAILVIDVALQSKRNGVDATQAITQASLIRFRSIMMTTVAALFGALPLAIESGEGSELFRPLGLTVAGGLIFSQAFTLYTTPVTFIYLDRLANWRSNRRRSRLGERRSQLPLSERFSR
jgi:multidrug efflux pump